ncbi:MAG: 2-phospho-L-lactate transferase CofD family protein [Halieaceae bacterium]|jgi:LPPG:FO 2-phospho-L-lactate transferase|nr:2-phospho-L-lactate transferase CofD family protein [Halieaceae bacterium]
MFQLGDRDLATHLQRSQLLREGKTLSQVTRSLCEHLGIGCELLPMSDMPVRTEVETEQGAMPFQTYFVREQCGPRVRGFRFAGVDTAPPQSSFSARLEDPELGLVVICPSNPFVSVDPILALPGVLDALQACPAPVVAVSPIVGGRALKGPAAKMLAELGLETSAQAVATRYQGLVDTFVLDETDVTLAPAIRELDMDVLCLPTVMKTAADKRRLAHSILQALCPSALASGERE